MENCMSRRPPKKKRWYYLSRDEVFKLMPLLLFILNALLYWAA
jgi:hypothetical protein